MLEKSAKLSTLIQGFAALVFLYSYFLPQTTQQGTNPAVLHPMFQQSWLPLTSILLLVVSVIVSSILNFVVLRRRKGPLPSSVAESLPPPKLVIHRAVYGIGPQADVDITESLRKAARDALVIPVDNNLVPRDPAIGVRKRLVVEYSYGDGIVCCASRMESMQGDIARLVLPEDSELPKLQKELSHWQAKYSAEKTSDLTDKANAENKVLQLEAKLNELSKPDNSLLSRLTALVRDVLVFLHDQQPMPEIQPGELESEKGKRFAIETEKRIHRIHSGFSLRLHPEIDKITLELGEKGIFDYHLATLMQNSAHSEANISEISDKLIALRDRLEKLEYGGGE